MSGPPPSPEHAVREAVDPARGFVAIVEVDRFASLRRQIGYTMANDVLAELSRRVQAAIGACKMGRTGRTSIEFAFAAASHDDALTRLAAVVAAIERPVLIDGHPFDLTVAIGVADAGARAIDDQLIDLASAALVEAQQRHCKVRIADAATSDETSLDTLSIMRELRVAMQEDALALHYQPKLRSRTETVDSAEALLRWFHPEFGLVRTDKLIELTEATGAIRELTHWVIDRAIADRARLAAEGHPLTIFVNISGVLLPDRAFADWAIARVAAAGGGIGFEITETAVIHDPADAIANLTRFAEAGIRIAIDDYGSGLSSLAYLKQLPAHELKIDRMFVSGLTESHRDPLLVRSSIDLAHALEMEVTAEGVDDPLSLSLLRIMGCDILQGYLISPPLAYDEFRRFLVEGLHHDRLSASLLDIAGQHLGQAARSA